MAEAAGWMADSDQIIREALMRICKVEANQTECNCTYPCERKGICCECVACHRRAGELPACYFSESAEKTYDRSIENYNRTQGSR